jgi:hypothetical protein
LKKNGGGHNHLQIKLPKTILLPRIHVDVQPMAANTMCSDQLQKVIGFIQKAWAGNGSIDEVMEKHNAQLSSRDISSMLLELQRCHDWQCTLVVLFCSPPTCLPLFIFLISVFWYFPAVLALNCLSFCMGVQTQLFHWMKKQPWHRPNSRLYTRLIGFLGREGQVRAYISYALLYLVDIVFLPIVLPVLWPVRNQIQKH